MANKDSDELCGPCHLNEGPIKAVGMCITCQDFLCQGCFDVHKIPRPLSSHELLTKSQMVHDQIRPTRKDVCREYCRKHGDKVITYHCLDCDKLGCDACSFIEHKVCDNVKYIPDVAKDLQNNQTFLDINAKLQMMQHKVNTLCDTASQMTGTLEKTGSTTTENFRQFKKAVIEALDKIEGNLEQKTTGIKTEAIDDISKLFRICKHFEDNLQKTVDKVEIMKAENQNCSLYTYMVQISSLLQSIDDQLDKASQELTEKKVILKFAPNDEILYTLKSSDAMGQVSLGYRTIERAEFVKDIPVKLFKEKNCNITGCVVLSNNKMVIADYKNKNLKSVEVQDGSVKLYLTLSSDPWDIALIEDKQLAVTLPYMSKIAFVNLKPKPCLERYIDVEGGCFGVAYKEDKLAVSYTNPRNVLYTHSDRVEVLTLQGIVLHTIRNNDKLFSDPLYIAFGQDSNLLYVTNWLRNNVVSVNVDGTVQATYTDSQLRSPYKVVMDSRGIVYVCATRPPAVHQLSSDLKKIQVILSSDDYLKKPHIISFSDIKSEIYIGGHNNTLKVFSAILSHV